MICQGPGNHFPIRTHHASVPRTLVCYWHKWASGGSNSTASRRHDQVVHVADWLPTDHRIRWGEQAKRQASLFAKSDSPGSAQVPGVKARKERGKPLGNQGETGEVGEGRRVGLALSPVEGLALHPDLW